MPSFLNSGVRIERGFTMPVGIDGDDDTPRSSFNERRRSCSNPFSPFNNGLPRLSFSYHKLPPQLIKLSVVKLDGSSFDVQIAGNATVGELKESVEDVFIQSPKEDEGEISWSHVWGHFCLCYEGQKLTKDKDYVRNFGIKDGDKLHFIRHLSISYKLMNRRSRRQNVTFKDQSLCYEGFNFSEREDSGDYVSNDRYGEDRNGDQHEEDNIGDWPDDDSKYYNHEHEDFIGQPEFKLAHYLKGWLSYSKLWFVGRTKSECKIQPSRFSGQFLKVGSKMRLTSL